MTARFMAPSVGEAMSVASVAQDPLAHTRDLETLRRTYAERVAEDASKSAQSVAVRF